MYSTRPLTRKPLKSHVIPSVNRGSSHSLPVFGLSPVVPVVRLLSVVLPGLLPGAPPLPEDPPLPGDPRIASLRLLSPD
jgi:hypothetical protein